MKLTLLKRKWRYLSSQVQRKHITSHKLWSIHSVWFHVFCFIKVSGHLSGGGRSLLVLFGGTNNRCISQFGCLSSSILTHSLSLVVNSQSFTPFTGGFPRDETSLSSDLRTLSYSFSDSVPTCLSMVSLVTGAITYPAVTS